MAYKDPSIQRDYQRRWYQRRRCEWIVAHGPCAKCGSWVDLEVDHKDRKAKSLNVRSVWGMSEANPRRVAELAKCWVLCKKCHRLKSNYELSVAWYINHPTLIAG